MLKHCGLDAPELQPRLICVFRLVKLMAPSRKSRSVNKRLSSANEAFSSKYVEDASKSKQKVCMFVMEDDLCKIYSVCRLTICL